LNKPVAPPPPPATKPDLPSTKALDEAAVRDVIKRYELALNAGNADALLTVWPTMKYGKYKDLFKNREANHLNVSTEVKVETLNISETGEEATLSATLLVNSTSKGDRTQSRKEPAVIRLVKNNAGWVISEIR
jgi:ketosteroid isomerase-like protein